MSRLYAPFARLYDPILGIPLRSLRNHVLQELASRPDAIILDLCCGTGSQLRTLQRNGFRHLHGIDLSLPMLNVAATRSDALHLSLQDASRCGIRDESVDVVILSLALHEKDAPTRDAILSEAHRMLKPAGTLLVADYDLSRESGRLAARVIHIIEWLAGGNHFQNFRSYVQSGGLCNIIDPVRFHLHATHPLSRRTLALNRYRKT